MERVNQTNEKFEETLSRISAVKTENRVYEQVTGLDNDNQSQHSHSDLTSVKTKASQKSK